MSKNKFQRRVRTRMQKTGESYQAAHQALSIPKVQKFPNILEYLEPKVVPPTVQRISLSPVQKVVLKLLYGLPLDNHEIFEVRARDGNRLLPFTEKSYVEHLHVEERCNISTSQGEHHNLFLAAGRCSGKTSLQTYILNYEVDRLLSLDDPQKTYGLPPTTVLSLIAVGMGYEHIGFWRGSFFQTVERLGRTRPLAKKSSSRVGSYQPGNQENAPMHVVWGTPRSSVVRGRTSVLTCFDEFAHFQYPAEVYMQNLSGQVEGHKRIVCSTPHQEGDFFHTEYTKAQKDPARGLTLQIPTWELNPTYQTRWIQEIRDKDPRAFRVEYGAEFLPPLPKKQLTDREVVEQRIGDILCVCPQCESAMTTVCAQFFAPDQRPPVKQGIRLVKTQNAVACDACADNLKTALETEGYEVELVKHADNRLLQHLKKQLDLLR